MLRSIASRLTYGNVVATLALFIALGGVGYAATQLPADSVGNDQLKNDAVTGANVRNGSLGIVDLSSSAQSALQGRVGTAGSRSSVLAEQARAPRAEAAADAPVTTGSVTHLWSVTGNVSRVTRLEVTGIAPANATVKVLCHGRGCPFASRSFTPRGGRATLTSAFSGRRLAAGSTVDVIIVAAGTTGRYLSFEIRPSAVPRVKTGCSAPGSLSPIGCPGPAGAKGDPGPAGAPGAQGPPGLSEAITHTEAAALVITAAQDVLSINLPAGSWIVFARMDAANATSNVTRLECRLLTPGDISADFFKTRLAANTSPTDLVFASPSMEGPADLPGGGVVHVQCGSTSGTGIELIARQITAVRVGKVSVQ